jgi:hypothetical protein
MQRLHALPHRYRTGQIRAQADISRTHHQQATMHNPMIQAQSALLLHHCYMQGSLLGIKNQLKLLAASGLCSTAHLPNLVVCALEASLLLI